MGVLSSGTKGYRPNDSGHRGLYGWGKRKRSVFVNDTTGHRLESEKWDQKNRSSSDVRVL